MTQVSGAILSDNKLFLDFHVFFYLFIHHHAEFSCLPGGADLGIKIEMHKNWRLDRINLLNPVQRTTGSRLAVMFRPACLQEEVEQEP